MASTLPAGHVCECEFEVRFGTENGERRAYLTADWGHDNPGTVVDLAVTGGTLVVRRDRTVSPRHVHVVRHRDRSHACR